jgi:hypothetical protein
MGEFKLIDNEENIKVSSSTIPMKVYLSASWDDRDIVIEFKDRLYSLYGDRIVVTCSWWEHVGRDTIIYAFEDRNGVDACDLFILYNTKKKTGGKLIEYGMACGLRKIVWVYGIPLTTIFRHLSQYRGEKLPERFE